MYTVKYKIRRDDPVLVAGSYKTLREARLVCMRLARRLKLETAPVIIREDPNNE